MIILNGMVGLSLLIGGWERPEQAHDMQGANAYLGVIIPLATLSLVMPSFLSRWRACIRHEQDRARYHFSRSPAAVAGLVMAVLVATPEAISAVRAAIANRLQGAVNNSLGSVLSTIAITLPAILLVGHLTGHPVTLGLTESDLVMLLVTLAVSIITFASGRTHVMQGADIPGNHPVAGLLVERVQANLLALARRGRHRHGGR
jgi:Ca2+/H+ antiporter